MIRFSLFIILILSLAACDEEIGLDDPLQAPEAAQMAPTIATIVPGCDTPTLENWFETVAPTAAQFRQEAQTYADQPPSDALLSGLGRLSIHLTEVEVPECVAPVHGTQQDIMRQVLQAFSAYHDGALAQEDLSAQVADQIARYDSAVAPRLEEIEDLLLQRFQAGD